MDKPCETKGCETILINAHPKKRFCDVCLKKRKDINDRVSMKKYRDKNSDWDNIPYCSKCEKGNKNLGRKFCMRCKNAMTKCSIIEL